MTTTTWTKAERFDGEGALIAADLDNGARAVIYGRNQDQHADLRRRPAGR